MSTRPTFRAGGNIALKVPLYRYEATLAFYRDALGLPYLGSAGESHVFQYGPLRLWLDPVAHQSQVDVWLEVVTPDLAAGTAHLAAAGVPVRDELEPLGDLAGHWISDPAGVVLLLTTGDAGDDERARGGDGGTAAGSA